MATHSNRRIRESYELLEKKEKAMDLELEKLAEESTAKYVAYMDAFHKWQNFHDQVASDKAYMAKRKAVSFDTF